MVTAGRHGAASPQSGRGARAVGFRVSRGGWVAAVRVGVSARASARLYPSVLIEGGGGARSPPARGMAAGP